ncbi:Creatinase/aminopeptidase [Cytidiella melzeri]|nr:Creatinase/aminopeptidase [Cytidiella melzeri]
MYPSKDHVVKTFAQLVKLLPPAEQTKPQVALLAGGVTPYRNDTDREMSFRQESNFFYLSGCSIPSSYLLVTYKSGTSFANNPSIQLFIPGIEPADIMWSVPPPTVDEAVKTHEATHIAHPSVLSDAINDIIKAYPDATFHILPRGSPLFPALSEDYLGLVRNAPISDKYLLPALHQARLTKDVAEVAEIKRANEISSRAHETVMRVLGQGVKGLIKQGQGAGVTRPLLPGEWLIEKEAEAEALFVASCRREGAVHQAYLPIVAASNRASTLHYCCNDKEFAWGPVKPHDHKNDGHIHHANEDKTFLPQVLLIDAGCEWNYYAADITRTMPVGNGGKFTPEAREIYSLVLDMQKLAMEALKPGIHWDAIQLICHRTLVKGLQRLGILKSPDAPGSGSWNSEEAIIASGVSAAFFPHGVGHSLGLDVHDVPSASKPAHNPTIKGLELGHPDFYTYLRLRLPLEEGMVVTVEPGIYFSPHLLAPVRDSKHINHDVLKKYESVGGVRIEDVVLITKDGHLNLTTVRSDVDWVEGVCSGEL